MTTFGVLDSLISEDFDLELTFYSTPNALRRRLLQSSETRRVREDLATGALTEATVERFVAELMKDLRPRERFPHQTALAGLAVAFESRYTEFARTYLETLASLKLSEMSLSIGVAKLALQHRSAKPVIIDLGTQTVTLDRGELACIDMKPGTGKALRSSNTIQKLRPTGTC